MIYIFLKHLFQCHLWNRIFECLRMIFSVDHWLIFLVYQGYIWMRSGIDKVNKGWHRWNRTCCTWSIILIFLYVRVMICTYIEQMIHTFLKRIDYRGIILFNIPTHIYTYKSHTYVNLDEREKAFGLFLFYSDFMMYTYICMYICTYVHSPVSKNIFIYF